MLKFETIEVVVRDEKKAARFWKGKIGFRVVRSWPHWVTETIVRTVRSLMFRVHRFV